MGIKEFFYEFKTYAFIVSIPHRKIFYCNIFYFWEFSSQKLMISDVSILHVILIHHIPIRHIEMLKGMKNEIVLRPRKLSIITGVFICKGDNSGIKCNA